MRLSRIAIVLIIFLSGITKIAAQDVAIKTNGLYWLAGGTINGGVEVATSNRVTLQLSGSYNPWTYRNDKKMRFWLVEPEVKYWLCEKFERPFLRSAWTRSAVLRWIPRQTLRRLHGRRRHHLWI